MQSSSLLLEGKAGKRDQWWSTALGLYIWALPRAAADAFTWREVLSVTGELRFNNVTESRGRERGGKGGEMYIKLDLPITFNGTYTIRGRPLEARRRPASSTEGSSHTERFLFSSPFFVQRLNSLSVVFRGVALKILLFSFMKIGGAF